MAIGHIRSGGRKQKETKFWTHQSLFLSVGLTSKPWEGNIHI